RRHYDRDHAPPGSGLYGRTASAIDQLSARPACGAAVFPLHGRCGKHRRGVPALPAWQESLPERGRESAEAAARSGPGRCRDALSGVPREVEEPAHRGVQVTHSTTPPKWPEVFSAAANEKAAALAFLDFSGFNGLFTWVVRRE